MLANREIVTKVIASEWFREESDDAFARRTCDETFDDDFKLLETRTRDSTEFAFMRQTEIGYRKQIEPRSTRS